MNVYACLVAYLSIHFERKGPRFDFTGIRDTDFRIKLVDNVGRVHNYLYKHHLLLLTGGPLL